MKSPWTLALASATLVCCAACGPLSIHHQQPVRVLVLNMHAGKDAAGKRNLDGISALVTQVSPDLVLLQEVDRRTTRSGGEDQVDALSSGTRLDAAFAASLLHYDGGQYGIALLSRGAIGFSATQALPVTPGQTRAGGSHEPRVALVAFAGVRQTDWTVINTHLDPSDQQARTQEVAALVAAVRDQQLAARPLVVGGDFNSTPDNPVLQMVAAMKLHDAWTECGSGDGFTYPANAPAKRIDYLWLSADLHCATAQVVDTQISDHRPLLVTMR